METPSVKFFYYGVRRKNKIDNLYFNLYFQVISCYFPDFIQLCNVV
jgi:hypothetical protein